MRKLDQIYLKDAKAWRKWLSLNYDKVPGIWLIYYKKHTNKPRVSYNEAVEEALCYGWIDSTVKRIDDERYMQQFTPRNLKSNWSEPNKKRVDKLITEGKITDAGHKLITYAKQNGLWNKTNPPQVQYEFSENLMELIRLNDKAFQFFSSLSPSAKKLYTQWVMSAKRPETRLKRCGEMILMLEKKKKLGMK